MTSKKFNKIYSMTDTIKRGRALGRLSNDEYNEYIRMYNERMAAEKQVTHAYVIIEKDVTPMYMMF